MNNTENHRNPKLKIEGFSEAELKQKPFKTPDNYFENLTPRVMESLRASERSSVNSKFSWNHTLIPALGIAAAVLAALFFYNPASDTNPTFNQVLASITIDEIVDYTETEPTELLAYGLIDYNGLSQSDDSFTDEDIIDYLSNEEEIELNTLIDEIDI